jgi:hypothetical protein
MVFNQRLKLSCFHLSTCMSWFSVVVLVFDRLVNKLCLQVDFFFCCFCLSLIRAVLGSFFQKQGLDHSLRRFVGLVLGCLFFG